MVTVPEAVSLLGMLKLSVNAPAVVGENVMLIVQVAVGAIVWFEHVSFVREKGATRGFDDPIAPMTRLAIPLLPIVTIFELSDPTETLPKGTDRSVAGATGSVTVIVGEGAGVLLATAKVFVDMISSPWLALFGSTRHLVPKKPPDLSFWWPYQEALKV